MAGEYGDDASVFNGGRAAGVGTLGTMDTAKVAGLMVLGALGLLAVMRKSFGGVNIRIGD